MNRAEWYARRYGLNEVQTEMLCGVLEAERKIGEIGALVAIAEELGEDAAFKVRDAMRLRDLLKPEAEVLP